MRTLDELRSALADANVQEVARRSGVNAKTIYRIRQIANYTPGLKKAERISHALDLLADSRAREAAQPEKQAA